MYLDLAASNREQEKENANAKDQNGINDKKIVEKYKETEINDIML